MTIKYGTNTSNNLYGTQSPDFIYGWDQANAAGDFGPATDNDRLYSSGGDLLSGGGGDDTLFGGKGNETLLGGTGNDELVNAGLDLTSPSQFDGGAGIDLYTSLLGGDVAMNFSVLSMSAGVTLVDGSRVKGVERIDLNGSSLADSILGGFYDDTVFGLGGDDVLTGNIGNDLLVGGLGRDSLFGGDGDDTLVASALEGKDELRGGLGIDLLAYNASEGKQKAFTMVLGYTVTLGNGTTATGFERLEYMGSGAADKVTGGSFDDVIDGGVAGKDVLTGRDGDDMLFISRTSGDAVTLFGGDGDDTLVVGDLTEGSVIRGGDGVDLLVVDLRDNTSGIALSADMLLSGSGSPAGAAEVRGIERFQFIGTDASDTLTGGAFDDIMTGNLGDDSLAGSAGNDTLDGGQGNDTTSGGDGDDVLTESQGYNLLFGADGDDLITIGTAAAKDQFLYGGNGDDTLTGGLANDALNGSAGSDVLEGRGGADAFTFNTAPVVGEVDTIADFVSGTDTIVLRATAFAGLVAGDLAAANFVLGTAAKDASDRILYDKANGGVWYDADGKGGVAAVQFADLGADTVLTADDFLIV